MDRPGRRLLGDTPDTVSHDRVDRNGGSAGRDRVVLVVLV